MEEDNVYRIQPLQIQRQWQESGKGNSQNSAKGKTAAANPEPTGADGGSRTEVSREAGPGGNNVELTDGLICLKLQKIVL